MELLIVKQVLSLCLYNATMFHGCEQDSEVCLIDTLLTVGLLFPWDYDLLHPYNPEFPQDSQVLVLILLTTKHYHL